MTHLDPRAMREVYLLPFQMVVRDADPWCMMTAYNKVNGFHCDASKELLIDIAREEWGWDGVFMSDWGGTNTSVESINNGLDLEMPGPPLRRSQVALEEPLQQGLVDLKRVDESAARIIRLLQKAGRFTAAPDDPEYCRDDQQTKSLLLQAASGGIVMLKNEENALPLKPSENIRKLAVLGPNAKRVVAGGGGSAYIKAPYWTSVFDSLTDEFTQNATEVVFAEGSRVNRYLPTMSTAVARNPDTGMPGAAIDWHLSHDLGTEPVAKTHAYVISKTGTGYCASYTDYQFHSDDLYFMSFGTVPQEVDSDTNFSFRFRTILKPLTSGRHKLSLASIGPAELYMDGKLITRQSGAFEEKSTIFFTYGSGESVAYVDVEASKEYEIRVDYRSHDRQLDPNLQPLLSPMEDKFQGVRMGYEEFDDSNLPGEAAQLASECDAAVVVVGRDKEWETEGEDIPIFELPGEQVRLIKEVAAVCKRTIVLVQAGTPVQLEPWIDDVQAVLYTWYQGQELGNAAAAVVCGKYNPSGRLPVTFPRRIEDCPAFSSFPGENEESYYSEGLYVGYRWWDLLGTKPYFPLGFGLSYNSFEVYPGSISSDLLLEGSTLTLTARVKNTGGSDLPGRQTVIAWFSQRSPTRLKRPVKQMCGFASLPNLCQAKKSRYRFRFLRMLLECLIPRERTGS